MTPKVSPGQRKRLPFRSARIINRVLDATDAYYDAKLLGDAVPRIDGDVRTDLVKVRNITGADKLQGHVLQTGAYLLTDIDPRNPWFEADDVAAPVMRKYVVLRQALKDQSIGWAFAQGVCVARVNVGSTSHTHAWPVAADDAFASSFVGPVEILTTPASTGEQELWVRLTCSVEPIIGKADGAIAKGASGTVSVWNGTPGSEADSGENITAYNKFADVASGTWVSAVHNRWGWYLIATECV